MVHEGEEWKFLQATSRNLEASSEAVCARWAKRLLFEFVTGVGEIRRKKIKLIQGGCSTVSQSAGNRMKKIKSKRLGNQIEGGERGERMVLRGSVAHT